MNEDFKRINEPRVAAAMDKLALVEKSAKSMKIHELDIVTLLLPLTKALDGMKDPLAVEMVEDQPARVRVTPHELVDALHRIAACLDDHFHKETTT